MKLPVFRLACALALGAGGLACTSSTTASVAGDGAALVLAPSFLPTMVVDIDGRPKAYRLSALFAPDASTARIELTTGVRALGDEATPGEIYSEVWIEVATGGAPVGGAYSCVSAAGGTSVAVTWSYNHSGIGPNSRNFATSLSGGPCAATFDAFGTTPGDRIKGSFSATLDGNHRLENGVLDLIVPRTIPSAGE